MTWESSGMRISQTRIFAKFLAAFLAVLLFSSSYCHADFVLRIGPLGVSPIIASQGDQVQLDLFIEQTNGETRLNSSATGLSTARFDFTVSDSSAIATSSFAIANLFDDATIAPISSLTPSGAFFAITSPGAPTTGITATNDLILLGSATIDISATALGNYTIGLEPDSAAAFTLASPGFPTVINVSPGEALIQVSASAVPEPSFFVLLTSGGGALCYFRRRTIVFAHSTSS
ncbi:PEP-CTERM sorting domain-containing protein [Rhodopirellula bahusiensis]|uniref:PEP-CTERM sorting domain-containing protein n=1 Tax=Rhodopirellula bahusiensis TaxID=2014065 RepID=UPI0032678B59